MKVVKKLTFIVFILISCLLVLITLLSTLYNNTSIWWIKITNFPRQQLLVLGCICILLMPLFIKKWTLFTRILTFAILLSVVIHGWFVVPYTPISKTEVRSYQHKLVKPEDKLALFIANVFMENRNVDALLNIIHNANPDIVFLVETNKWWQQAMQPLHEAYPYAVEYPLDNTYGLLLFSKYRLIDPKVLFLEKPTVPSVHTKVEMPNKRIFMFHGEHPVPPVPSDTYPDNTGQAAGELSKLAQMIKQEQLPAIVAGDFNDVAWSETGKLFRKNSELKDVRSGRWPYNSFNANSVVFRWPLDHIFTNPQFELISIAHLKKFGSDHFPIFVQLVLPKR
ncbi:endonuclease/exonuclease/phosphatase family protein [Adhaeribacter radiodurans]|uniref:Endonuclease/exonuclease/phosphatase family protein n=1 Tax=Adhaeribacter radiodurans TaxID=2745197 RepID=A0A7L7L1G3_9BACT|nr:endonuclease/exonuclease/phosphatase family protein [Adhaeribacter radiodurans]QMU26610.1 endonuclease/exonuclease/phosphatase family protein [Adhaeribacter radiodurans]